MRRPFAAAVLCFACLFGGCGAERASRVQTTVRPGAPVARKAFPRAGVELTVPRAAVTERKPAPGVFRVSVGESFVSVFAYRRSEQLPRNRRDLEAARKRLVRETRSRSRGYRLVSSRLTRLRGAPAIELVGDQTIARAGLRTRSLHVFKGQGEFVLEMLAPERSFPESDRTFFAPLLRSLRLSGRIEPAAKKRG
jgi:hypothetical protein